MSGNTWGEWEDRQGELFDPTGNNGQMSLPFGADGSEGRAVLEERGAGEYEHSPDDPDLFTGSNYQIPTATTNPERPRTVAAKYEPDQRAVYVVMRPYTSHGTLVTPIIKYEDCSALDWQNFRRSYSKGQFIYQNWDGNKTWVRAENGGADSFLLSAASFAEAQQRSRQGTQIGQSTSSSTYKKLQKHIAAGGKVTRLQNKSGGKLGGTGRKRNQEKLLNDATAAFYRNKT